MRYLSMILSLMLVTYSSCNNDSKQSAETIQTTDTVKSPEMKIMVPGTFCYSMVMGKDSVFLKTEVFPNVVTGNLAYHFYEKDSNKGTIDGVMKGDTLFADYTFLSEGKSSVRQVAFIIKDGVATEGYGDVEDKNGKTIFKEPGKLDFEKGIRLKKVECPIQ